MAILGLTQKLSGHSHISKTARALKFLKNAASDNEFVRNFKIQRRPIAASLSTVISKKSKKWIPQAAVVESFEPDQVL